VLTTDNTVLYDRLVKRGYSKHKVEENVQCEIMQVRSPVQGRSYDASVHACRRR
jgi:adenylate kinase